MTSRPAKAKTAASLESAYGMILGDISGVIAAARSAAARSVNCVMTAAYWLIGRRIVEFEQGGETRAQYGEELLVRLSADLTARFGRGFSQRNLQDMRLFYQAYPVEPIRQTPSAKSQAPLLATSVDVAAMAKEQTPSAKSDIAVLAKRFPLPWSAYVRLLAVKNEQARRFYEREALCGGWSVRQLDRQINSQFYERTALSKNKAAMLAKGQKALPEDRVIPEEEIKNPYVLEFLGLKDEYSETDLEEALIRRLETFLLELGGDFCFVGRQKRLRIGDEWYRVDLLFFHRRLRCLVVIDLKIGRFTHADASQMHLYLNYAREHWVRDGENPPVGLSYALKKMKRSRATPSTGFPTRCWPRVSDRPAGREGIGGGDRTNAGGIGTTRIRNAEARRTRRKDKMKPVTWHAVTKGAHYYLSLAALTKPMQVREDEIRDCAGTSKDGGNETP